MLYRIYTESVNPSTIEDLANKFLGNCTILEGIGLFNNESEKSTIIEYVTGTVQDQLIRELAYEIGSTNNQQAVLVQRLNNKQFTVLTG